MWSEKKQRGGSPGEGHPQLGQDPARSLPSSHLSSSPGWNLPWDHCGPSGSSAHNATRWPWGRVSPWKASWWPWEPCHLSKLQESSWPRIRAYGLILLLPTARPALPFGGVSSMSFFWQKAAGNMAWEEAW